MVIILIILNLVIFLFGYFIGRTSAKIDGYIIVDDSDEERTKWVFDLKKDPSGFLKQKYVRFKVAEVKQK